MNSYLLHVLHCGYSNLDQSNYILKTADCFITTWLDMLVRRTLC